MMGRPVARISPAVDPGTLNEFHDAARTVMDPVHFDYVNGAARDEITAHANEEAFRTLRLLPRVLRGSDRRSLRVDLLGTRVRTPVFCSPTAFHKLFDSEGERATARAAARAGALLVASMAATVSVEDTAAAAREADPDAALWFQMYLQPDHRVTDALVHRAERAGVKALVITVDSPVLGRNERNDRNAFHDLPAGLACENLRHLIGDEPGHVRQIEMSAEFRWHDVERLRSVTELPILLKGVLHPADGRTAVDIGVDGLLLSNHGGRQLDTVPPTIDLLPAFVTAVDGNIPILLDGGVRRGTDVVKALALGAAAVGIGRPVVWGLAVDGEHGVSRVLSVLTDEVDHAMALCGAASIDELSPDLVRPAGPVSR